MYVYMHILYSLCSFLFPLTKSSQNYIGPLRPSVIQLCHLTVKKTEIESYTWSIFLFPNIILLLPILITNHNKLWSSSSNVIGTIIKTAQVSLPYKKLCPWKLPATIFRKNNVFLFTVVSRKKNVKLL